MRLPRFRLRTLMIAVAVFALGIAGYVWWRNEAEQAQALRMQALLRAYRPYDGVDFAVLRQTAQRPSIPVAPVPPACW